MDGTSAISMYIWYVRRGLRGPPFFFLRRVLCAVQSSCTVLFRCARPTHALHASSIKPWCVLFHTYVDDIRTVLTTAFENCIAKCI